jgi:hypothetical protein
VGNTGGTARTIYQAGLPVGVITQESTPGRGQRIADGSAGNRLIVIHAGLEDGCVACAQLIYRAESVNNSYHGQTSVVRTVLAREERCGPMEREGSVVRPSAVAQRVDSVEDCAAVVCDRMKTRC